MFLAERGVPMIDVLDALRGHDETVFNDYLHYTPEGNRWVAERIAELLRPQIAAWAARQTQRD